jgi:hypothetical protein
MAADTRRASDFPDDEIITASVTPTVGGLWLRSCGTAFRQGAAPVLLPSATLEAWPGRFGELPGAGAMPRSMAGDG